VRRDSVAKLPIPIIAKINQAQNLADLIALENMWEDRFKEAKVLIAKQSHKDIKNIDDIKKLLGFTSENK
jgi:spermidine/putrescine-binding protein